MLIFPLLLVLPFLLHLHPSIIFPPSDSDPPTKAPQAPTTAIILVDPFSELHSQFIRSNLLSQNIAVIEVLSPYIANGLNKDAKNADSDFDYLSMSPDVTNQTALASWVNSVESNGLKITSVICESDSGLSYAEVLSSLVSAKHNGIQEGRRNKYLMNEICKSNGINTVKQKLCTSVREALDSYNNFSSTVILKPELGVASENVYKCSTESEVESAAENILNANTWGSYRKKVDKFLVQEYVEGEEYVLDCVSKNGEHKCTAMWLYDKTEFKKYRGTRLVSCSEPERTKMADYIFSVLTALNVTYGMSHNEVKITKNGDVKLIEVNCRQHNANIAPLTSMCIGYNTLDVVVSAYVDGELFDSIPKYPILNRYGTIVHLQCTVEGRVKKLKGLEEIENLPSTAELDFFHDDFGIDCDVAVTESIRTDCGFVILINGDEAELERDYERICELMKTMIVVRRRKRDKVMEFLGPFFDGLVTGFG